MFLNVVWYVNEYIIIIFVLITTIFEQRNQVMVANLGDSRAVMIGKSENGEIEVVQLTNDLKPSVPSKFMDKKVVM